MLSCILAQHHLAAVACLVAIQPPSPATKATPPQSADESIEARSEPPRAKSDDERWAEWARLRHWIDLERGCSTLENTDGPEPGAPETPGPPRLPAWRWPFEGKAPPPPLFQSSSDAMPAATMEWRRRDGTLIESHTRGDAGQIADCRFGMEAMQKAIQKTMQEAMQKSMQKAMPSREPPPDWTRSPAIPLVCEDGEGYLENGDDIGNDHLGERREGWCSAWADWYPIDGSRLRLVIATDPVRSKSQAFVLGTGEDGDGHIASAPLDGLMGPSSSSASPLLMKADFDANGTADFFLANRGTSLGIAITGYTGIFILADRTTRTAKITPFDAYDIELIDHDRNGRAEILTRSLRQTDNCLDDRLHSFWVWNLLGFQDLGIVDLRGIDVIRHGAFAQRFPYIEWFSDDPAKRFRRLLSDEQREAISDSGFPLYRRRNAAAASATR